MIRVREALPRSVWAVAAVKVLFHLATTRLEQHRDELYFVAASKRLAFSYVDFQPVTPLLLRAERALFGESLVGLRLIPALAGAATIVLGALIARELGAGARGQILAAVALALSPLIVGANAALNTVSLEIPAFMLVALVLARISRTGDARLFVALGAAAGLSLLVKFTALAYLVAVAVAIVATPLRRHLRGPWLWAGVGVAAAIVTPSVIWQFTHHLAVVEFVRHQGGGGAVLGLRGRAGYVASLLIIPGPFALLLTVPGLRMLVRRTPARALAITVLVAIVGFFVAAGKGYYAGPAIAVLISAGAVVVAGWTAKARRNALIALAVNLLLPLPLLVPVIPTSVLRGNADIAQATELSERIGWRQFAQQVAKVKESLPRYERGHAIFLGQNYTLPSAIEFYANTFDVPRIAVSGHNSAYLWWPYIPPNHIAIAVGFDETDLRRLYRDVRRVGTVTNREGVHGYDWGDQICIARGPKVSVGRMRELLKDFEA